MVNYNNGKIYKIEAINGEEGDIYIGSTTKDLLSQRMSKHRSDYKRWKLNEINKTTSYILFEKYGMENCRIVLIENVNAISKDELLSHEALHIKSMSCINKQIPMRTRKEYAEDNKERIAIRDKKYYEENKEHIKEKMTLYKVKNKKEISLQNKLHRENNKEMFKEINKLYYENNKEKIKLQKKLYYEKKKLHKDN
jgi:hypothetical protein